MLFSKAKQELKKSFKLHNQIFILMTHKTTSISLISWDLMSDSKITDFKISSTQFRVINSNLYILFREPLMMARTKLY